jgi:branched-chain amino acid transport system substrate-binding protein
MNKPSRPWLAFTAGLSVLSLAVAGCSGPARKSSPVAAAPGIAHGSITIGSYQPLTGAGAAQAREIAPASAAYFSYVNAHGGIYGRKIIYRYVNDRANPVLAPSIVHALVEQDNALAIFGGTGDAATRSVSPFLASAAVPDLFPSSGCPCWDTPSTLPQTFGWQLDYLREGKILGAFTRQNLRGRIALVYSADEPGLDARQGASWELPMRRVAISERVGATAAPSPAQVAALRASGARIVLAICGPASVAGLLLELGRLHWHPRLVAASAGADPATLATLLGPAGWARARPLAQGMITDSFLPPPGSASSPWIRLFRRIHDHYIPRLPFDTSVVDGMAAAYTFTEAMLRAGPHPTRPGLLAAVSNGLPQGPTVTPLGYSPASHAGATGAMIDVIRGAVIVPLGPVMITSGDSPASPVTPYTAAQPPAPSRGLPPQ